MSMGEGAVLRKVLGVGLGMPGIGPQPTLHVEEEIMWCVFCFCRGG